MKMSEKLSYLCPIENGKVTSVISTLDAVELSFNLFQLKKRNIKDYLIDVDISDEDKNIFNNRYDFSENTKFKNEHGDFADAGFELEIKNINFENDKCYECIVDLKRNEKSVDSIRTFFSVKEG